MEFKTSRTDRLIRLCVLSLFTLLLLLPAYYDSSYYNQEVTTRTTGDVSFLSSSKSGAKAEAELVLNEDNISYCALYNYLVTMFERDDAEYAVDNLNIEWSDIALARAKELLLMYDYTEEEMYSQLVLIELFTHSEANYAIGVIYNDM